MLVGSSPSTCAAEQKVSWRKHRDESNIYQSPKILYIDDYYPISDPEQQKLFDGFFGDLESTFSTKRTIVSLSDLWNSEKPAGSEHTSLKSYMEDVSVTERMQAVTEKWQVGVASFCYGLYHELAEFQDKYHKAFNKEPYVNPTTRWRW